LKIILGLLWSIILRFAVQDISEEELSAKEALLLWCQKKTKGYNNVDVKNFTRSFQDGLAFCALIHKHRPDLLDFDSLDPNDKIGNLNKAFDVADKHLDVAKLLDAEDVVNIGDEKSIITYVAALYAVFSSGQKAEGAAKNISQVLDVTMSIAALVDEYARRAAALRDWSVDQTSQLQDRNFPNSVDGVQGLLSEFKNWKRDQKASQGVEKTEVEALFNQIQTKLRINKRPAYVPPAGLHPTDLEATWGELNKAENERGVALRAELRRLRILENLVASFKLRQASVQSWTDSKSKLLQSTELGDTIEAVNANLRNLEAFNEDYTAQGSKLTQLNELKGKIVEGRHSEADQISAAYDALTDAFQGLQPQHESRKAALEAQLERLQKIQTLLVEYAKKALVFVRQLDDIHDVVSEPILADAVDDVQQLQGRLQEAESLLAQSQQHHDDVQSDAAQLHEAGVQETVYSEYSAADLSSRFGAAEQAIAQRRDVLAAELAKQEANEALRVSWANESAKFVAWADEQDAAIQAKSADASDLDATIAALRALSGDIAGHKADYDALVQLNQQVEDAEITENKHTTNTFESVSLRWAAIQSSVQNAQKTIENEVLLKQHSGVSAEELSEYEKAFAHFDKNGDGSLNRLELKSALQSLGEDPKDPELEQVLNQFGVTVTENEQNVRVMPFQSFVAYLTSKHSNTETAAAVAANFKTMANDKEFITEQELRSLLSADKAEYLIANMPQHSSGMGFDYVAYAQSVYA
jgi:actinin alpha